MKNKIIFLIIILFPFTTILPWGAKAHMLINKTAVEILPAEMNQFKTFKNYIEQHAADADKRKAFDKSEPHKHYIDIDYYKEFENGHMIEDEQKLISVYGDSVVNEKGILPWATLNTFNNLVQAFKEKNRDKILIYASDLGHYVGDGHQPMHTVVNYNGQLTGQKGVHFRYEVTMLDSNLDELQNIADPFEVKYVKNILPFVFNYITDANSVCGLLFEADNYAYKMSGSRESPEYYRLLWFRTKYITKYQIAKSEEDVASLFYSAWIDAGKPDLSHLN
jgi:S1/P1 Nuclease